MYLESGPPEALIHTVVSRLIASGQYAKAARELECVIQAGYHTTWAFQTLAATNRELQRGETEVLRAVSSETELFPRDAQPHINLAQFYEKANNPAAALTQYREAVRLKPDDGYFYRQQVERAIGLG